MSTNFIAKALRSKRLYAVVAIATGAALLLLVVGRGHNAAAQSQIPAGQTAAASAVVQNVLPGSSSTLVPTSLIPSGLSNAGMPALGSVTTFANTGAEQLQITIPASSFTPIGSTSAALATPSSPGTETNDSAAYELGWHAALAAGLAGVANTNIVSYAVNITGVTLTPAEQAAMQGIIRTAAGGLENGGTLADIGAVPYQTLLNQLQSNLNVLTSVLPQGTVLSSDAFAVPLDSSAGDYGLEADLKVTSLAVLQGHVGDIVNGLDTGLTGGPTAPSEGVAINIVDSQGRRVGWWSATRAASGSAIGDPILPVGGGTETGTFPNLTGGPAPTASASGAPGATAKSDGYALNPARGIGPVTIGETATKVNDALGAKPHSCSGICTRTYRRPQGVLNVTFRGGKVESITSTSPQITLHGVRLGLGLKRVKPLLRQWRYEFCVGYIYGHGPASTTLSFGKNNSVKVDVVDTRAGGCGLP